MGLLSPPCGSESNCTNTVTMCRKVAADKVFKPWHAEKHIDIHVTVTSLVGIVELFWQPEIETDIWLYEESHSSFKVPKGKVDLLIMHYDRAILQWLRVIISLQIKKTP